MPCKTGRPRDCQHRMEGPAWESCITGFRYQDAKTRECTELGNPLGFMRPPRMDFTEGGVSWSLGKVI